VSKLHENELRNLCGENSIEVPITPLYKLLLDEGLHPFIVFQLCSVVVWSLEDYYYYASLILAITIFSVVLTIYETRSNMKNLQQMTKFECDVKIKKKGMSMFILNIYMHIYNVLVHHYLLSIDPLIFYFFLSFFFLFLYFFLSLLCYFIFFL
jgi:hypothetical protein